MAQKQRLNIRHKAVSQMLPIGKRLMVRKQGRDEIDILNIGLALARQHVGALRYERKLRPYRQATLLKVPPFEVPIEVALAVIEDNAASSMLVAAKRILRKSRCQVGEAVAPENIGSEIERDSEYCCVGPVEPTGRAYLDLIPRIMEDGVPEVLVDALEEHYRRARASHGWQDHGYRRTGVRIDPTGNYLRWPAQSLNEIQQLPVVAKTVDLEPHSREPVFDAPAILAERVNFDRAMRVQHREQILHRIGQRLFSSRGDCRIFVAVWRQRLGHPAPPDGRRIAISSMPIAANSWQR